MLYIASACVITILYTEGTAAIATGLRCLTTLVIVLLLSLLATKLDHSVAVTVELDS